MDIQKIRNFCIVAHIDHGKSTLADRILEITGAVSKRELRAQYLDDNAIERERGITIKAKAVALDYQSHRLNLIDTPGHVDFSYEVSRSLAAAEAALLVVDATQGVQAQTVANAMLALEAGLEIIPVVNKIDMATARPTEVEQELDHILGLKPDEVLRVSAKEGTGVPELMDMLLKRVPPPKGNSSASLQALIFDSVYDEYKGVIVYVRVMNGTLRKEMPIRLMSAGKDYKVEELGIFRPAMQAVEQLSAGEVGYLIANIKSVSDIHIGDTIIQQNAVGVKPLPGYKKPQPMVFCGFYPTGKTDVNELKKALERLSLNDASFKFQPESSQALGYGFRCGFLGLLHMEIVQERLEREAGVEIIQTAPNVTYEVVVQQKTGSSVLRIDNPAALPEEQYILEWREPIVKVNILTPADSIGSLMKLCEERRGTYRKTEYLSATRVMLTYELPFAEMIYDFYDKLKSITHGYGTMDYTLIGYRPSELVKLSILVAGDEVDALSTVVHRSQAEAKGRRVIQVLRQEIPRHMFQIALQAAVGKRVVAREDIKPFAKHVTGKCYGGDITRKRKLWEKQKEGKKRLKTVGRIEIPQKAFLAVLASPEE